MKKLLQIICIGTLILSSVEMQGDSCSTSNCNSSSSCSSDDSCHSCECQVTNKSFLSIRPYFEAASPAKVSLVRSEMQELRCNNGSLFQAVPFGGQTVKGEWLGQYFGPSCKRVLNVTEQQTNTTDILSGQLNIVTTDHDFASTFCLTPKQTFAGVGLNYRTHFGYKDQNKGFFIDLTMPVYYVRNLMNLNETIVNNGGGPASATNVDSVTAAFNQSAWRYGKINDCDDTSHAGISEIDAQIGYGWGKDQAFMHSYIGILIPTGNKVRGHKVFEPILGWNRNTAVHFGSNFGIELWQSKCNKYSIWYELAIDSRYFFENKQYRSFDLHNKPWSRYMMVYSNLAQATDAATVPGDSQIGTPGINLFTQELKVRPRFQRTYNTAFALDLVNWTLEAGYNFFCRDEECVKLACPWEQVAGVKYQNVNGTLVAVDGPALRSLLGSGQTDSVQLISNDFGGANAKSLANYAQNIITEDQLDLSTAQAPCLLSQRLYGSVGYAFDTCRFRTLLGLGGDYEFAGSNAGINRWGVWGKVALIF